MKIGLVRHYKVKKAYPKKFLVSYAELIKWFYEYDLAEIECNKSVKTTEWDVCYSSPSKRAIETAMDLHKSKPLIINELKELNVLDLMNEKLKLPFIIWGILIRNKAFSNNKITNDFKKELNLFIDFLLLKSDKEILVVSHGFVMMFLKKELEQRGFSGDKFKLPVNGKIYEYNK